MAPASERTWWWTFGALALLVAVAVIAPAYLPMVDWPQHGQQVAALADLALGRCEYAAIYRVNWLTPYWLGYLPATLLAFVLPVDLAMRLVLFAGLLALPLATRLLLRELGGDGWWSFAAFAALFGANFDWGFFNFLVAAPLALLVAWLTVRQLRAPSPARAAALALAGLGAFAGHAAAAACAFLLSGALALVVAAEIGLASVARRILPLLVPALVALAWLAVVADWEPTARDALRTGAGPLLRLAELPRLLTGLVDPWPALAAMALLGAALALGGLAPSPLPRRWLPLAVVLAVYTWAPNYLLGIAQVYPRLLVLLIPCALLALSPRRGGRGEGGWRRWLVVGAVATIVAAHGARALAFARESAGLREVLAAAPERERLLYLPLERESPRSLAPVYLHSGAWYPVGRCGVAAVSFASGGAYAPPVRFRPESAPRLPSGFEWHPDRLRWEGVRGQFGLFLVRSTRPVAAPSLFGGAGRVELLAQRGDWWLYRPLAVTGWPEATGSHGGIGAPAAGP